MKFPTFSLDKNGNIISNQSNTIDSITILAQFIALIIVIFLIIAVIYGIKKINKKSKPKTEYYPEIITTTDSSLTEYFPYEKKMLLSKAEYAFYNILKKKCDENNLIICPKVRMEDFLNVTDKKNILKYRGYIRSRHIDFMICNSKLFLLAGIELDDNTHMNSKVAQVDEFKDKVFQTINLPLFRIRMTQGMYENQIDNIIKTLIPKKEPITETTNYNPFYMPDIKN